MFRSAANVNIYFLNDYFNAISFNGVSSYLILTIKYYRSIFIFFPMCTFLLEFMFCSTLRPMLKISQNKAPYPKAPSRVRVFAGACPPTCYQSLWIAATKYEVSLASVATYDITFN